MHNYPEFSTFSALLRTALELLPDRPEAGLLDMVRDDVVFEFPYAARSMVRRVIGRDGLAEHFAKFSKLFELDRLKLEAVHRSDRGRTVVFEFTAAGRCVATGRPYPQRYVSVVELREGLIARYRDYWNPQVLLDAMGDSVSAFAEEKAS